MMQWGGLLDGQFDPDPEKNAQFKRGLLDFGLNMLAQGGKSTGQAFGNAGLLTQQARQQREQQAQTGAFRKLQMDEMTAQGEQRRAQAEAAKSAAQRNEAFRASLGAPVAPAQAASMQGGPTPGNAAQIGQQSAPNWQSLALQYPDQIDSIKKLAEAGNFGRSKVARTAEVDDGRGGKATRQLDDYGQTVGSDLPGYVAPVSVNRGGSIDFVKPQAGMSLPVSMSPSDRDASARGWAGHGLAKDRLAMEKSAPRGQFIETDNGFVLGDPRTGGVQPVVGADGQPLKGKAATRHLTEGQGKSTALAMRAIQSENQLGGMPGYNPSLKDRAAMAVPFDLARGAASDQSQMYDTSKRNFVSAVLRKETGAAVTEAEFKTYDKMFFPQVGDTPQVLAEKKQQRDIAIEGLMAESGPGRETINKNVQRKPAPPAGAPQPGTVDGGYVFNGGDPADPKNWRKQ